MLTIAQVDKIIYAISVVLSRSINRKRNASTEIIEKILIIRLDEIGDLCYTSPVFELLRKRYPKSHITLWCREFAYSLVSEDPHLNKIITDKKELDQKYDLIVDLRGKWEGLYYAMKHRPQVRVDRGTVRLKNKRKGAHPHEAITNFEIIQPLLAEGTQLPPAKIYIAEKDKLTADKFLSDHQLTRFAVFHTGARRELRKWPADRFAAIASMLKNQYDLDIVFSGDKSDVNEIQEIQQLLPFKTFSIADVLNLGSFAAFVSKAAFYIGNESGPLHIASVSGTRCIGLFGPGEPFVFYPRGEQSAVLHHILSCNPCDQIHCVHPSHPCIQRITVTEVEEKIKSMLD
ncbi:glycosyltransferase family 9 protein [soil metagenome]